MINSERRSPDIDVLLDTAVRAAVEAGKVAGEIWTGPLRLKSKGFRDIVTEADVTVQKLITEMIGRRFPQHGFVAEERDDSLREEGPVKWIIDPIDGTTNYSRQQPVFCVSIAGVLNGTTGNRDNKAVVGVIYDPPRRELFCAAAGKGSWLNERPIRVSSLESLGDWIVGIDWSHRRNDRQLTLDALMGFAHDVYTVRAMGSAALALAWVAAGRLDAYLNFSLKPWDTAAAHLLVEEAGGKMSDASGLPRIWPDYQGSCVASNGRSHDAFLRMINSRPVTG